MFQGKSSDAGVSSFQALAISLSGRVGTGNIAGVATAIAMGGPGAVFWMWLVAFLGASTDYVEATLAQIYKEKDEKGMYRGGPAYFIEKAMGQKWYAWLFAACTIIAVGFCLPGIQANSIVAAVENAWGVPPVVGASVIAFGVALIVFGGVRRIASFTQVVVPVMALGYILIALVVMGANYEKIPAMFSLIINSAFGLEAGYGAIIGMAIQWGVKRGIYSNEAGQGTAPHAAAAAEVSQPAKQVLVQAFSVYIDTLFVCTATAFMILLTGLYNVQGPDGVMLYTGLAGVEAGPIYVQSAFETILPGLGASLLAVSLFFFAFTTILAYYYIAATTVTYINRAVHRPWLMIFLKWLVLTSVMYGGIKSADLAWSLGDVGVDIGYIAFDYPENQTGLDFEEIYLGLSLGDFGVTLASGQDGAPDYTEFSYAFGPVSVAYGEYDDYGDNTTVSYGFTCGSFDCGITAYDFSDGGYGADEDGIFFSISASL